MTTQISLMRDNNGFVNYGLIPADDKASTTLTSAGGAQSFTVPSGQALGVGPVAFYDVVFGIDPGLRVFARYDGTAAALPGASVTTTGISELNPTVRRLPQGSTFSCITPDTSCYVTVMFYAVS